LDVKGDLHGYLRGARDGHDNLRIGDPTAWRRFRDQIEDAPHLADGH
jgi:hypothetical protein